MSAHGVDRIAKATDHRAKNCNTDRWHEATDGPVYVKKFTRAAKRLVHRRSVRQEDADALVATAASTRPTTAPIVLTTRRPVKVFVVMLRSLSALVLALVCSTPAFAKLPDVTARGPLAVGITNVTFTEPPADANGSPRPLNTIIWYPATAGTGVAEGTTFRDASVRKGRWPLIIFSHGLCGLPAQSTFLTEVLASRGFVIAAPPHVDSIGNGYPACVSQLGRGFQTRVGDIEFVLDQMLLAARTNGSPFKNRIDRRRISIAGHSFGGQTVLRVADVDSRVRAVLAMAPALYGQLAATPLDIKAPTMVAVGLTDTLAPAKGNAEPYFAFTHGPRFLLEIERTGHFAFSDICAEGIFGTNGDCGPGTNTLDQDEAHAVVLRYAVPFLLRYGARKMKYAPLLTTATDGVSLEAHRR